MSDISFFKYIFCKNIISIRIELETQKCNQIHSHLYQSEINMRIYGTLHAGLRQYVKLTVGNADHLTVVPP